VEFFLYGEEWALRKVERAGFACRPIEFSGELPLESDLKSFDAVVADSYTFDLSHYKYLSERVSVVVAIDDLATEPLPVDLIVNQNLCAPQMYYRAKPSTRCLLGARYALLDHRFALMRSRPDPEETRVLVMMGAGDSQQQTEKVLKSLSLLPATFYVDVIVGAGNKHISAIKQAAIDMPMISYVHVDPVDVSKIMARAGLAIAAGGVTALELACLGVPSILITTAANQERPAQALADTGAAQLLGDYTQVTGEQIEKAASLLLEDGHQRQRMVDIGQENIDGNGAQRVSREILEQVVEKTGMTWIAQTIQEAHEAPATYSAM
jgi:UDP-2,4-diacetamido-2,4,6-trideoxy-beta-L-altropyranose hydrolase